MAEPKSITMADIPIPADPLIGKGYEPYVGTRQNGQTTEYFNRQTGAGFVNPDALVNYIKPYVPGVDATNIFDQIKKGIEIPKEVPAQTLENPTSPSDVNGLIEQNRKLRDQLLDNLTPTEDEKGLQRQLFDLQNESRNTQLNTQAGLNAIEDKVIPMEFITGQQASLQRSANLALQTNSFKQEPILQNLQLLQQSRQNILEKLNAQMQFGQADINLAMQLKQMDNEQQKAAQEFALKYRVSAPAYSYDGKTVYNTQTGKAYNNEQQFFKEFGFTSWKEVPTNFIQREFITDEQRNADRSFGLQQSQFDFSKTESNRSYGLQQQQFKLDQSKFDYQKLHSGQVIDTGQIDDNGNPVKGIFDGQTVRPINGTGASIASSIRDGATGGQCGTFAHTLVDFPPVGNMLAEKQAMVNKNGVKAAEWRQQGAQVGDVLIQNYGKYGHVSVVESVNGDGTITVKESNFANDQKVGTRTLSMNDKAIYGAIRGTPKGGAATSKNDAVAGPRMPGQYNTSKFTQGYYNTPAGQKALNNEQQYNTNFNSNQVIKDYRVVEANAGTMKKVIESGVGGPGDLSIVYNFMKALDPNSVVRETEFATAAKSGNIFQGAFAKYNGYFKDKGGFLPNSVKQGFLSIINSSLSTKAQQFNDFASQQRKTAYEQGLNPDHVATLVAPPSIASSSANSYLDTVDKNNNAKQDSGGWLKNLVSKVFGNW
jgi:hypothetical protein